MQGKGMACGYLLGQWLSQGWNPVSSALQSLPLLSAVLLDMSEPAQVLVTAKPKGRPLKCLQNCFYLKAALLTAISSEVCLYLLSQTLRDMKIIVKNFQKR